MECYERGILTEEDTGGLELTWGNTDAIIELVHQVAKRKGFGDILADGEKRAHLRIQRGSEKYIYHTKGISIVSDPRVRTYWGLAELTNTRGGEHLAADYAPSVFPQDFVNKYLPDNTDLTNPDIRIGKGKGLKWSEDWTAFINACGLCVFVWHPIGNAKIPFLEVPELLAKMVTAVSGISFTFDDLIEAGERIFNVEKAFNSREGLKRENDYSTLQSRFANEPIKDGPGKGKTFNPDDILDEYYEARGWDVPTSIPTSTKLQSLGLEEIANSLSKTIPP
jgi:aldehyde:ferredoxin oxidoreductase